MESQHMTQQVFASFIGVSPGTLSSIFTGRTNPTLNIVESIKTKIPSISSDWLLFGHGQMYATDSQQAVSPKPATAEANAPLSIDFDGMSSALSGGAQAAANSRGVSQTLNNQRQTAIKIIDKPERKIAEIRIFYDDQTWETFVPKK